MSTFFTLRCSIFILCFVNFVTQFILLSMVHFAEKKQLTLKRAICFTTPFYDTATTFWLPTVTLWFI